MTPALKDKFIIFSILKLGSIEKQELMAKSTKLLKY